MTASGAGAARRSAPPGSAPPPGACSSSEPRLPRRLAASAEEEPRWDASLLPLPLRCARSGLAGWAAANSRGPGSIPAPGLDAAATATAAWLPGASAAPIQLAAAALALPPRGW